MRRASRVGRPWYRAIVRVVLITVGLISTGCFNPEGSGDTEGGTTGGETSANAPTTGSASKCSWQRQQTTGSPGPRQEHSMVYDSDNDRVILFGGLANDVDLQDLWIFDGKDWTEAGKSGPPPPRRSHAAAYDEARRVMVVFGGAASVDGQLTPTGDTYLYDPESDTWELRSPPSSPSPRYAAAMRYYAGDVVLFGGNVAGLNKTSAEQWSWDGLNWSQSPSPIAPEQKRSRHMIEQDGAGALLMYGGCDLGSGCLLLTPAIEFDDTWTWDGATWQPSDGAKQGGHFGAMVLHRAENTLYRFGDGLAFTRSGAGWSPLEISDFTTGRYFAAAYHSSGILRFGGTEGGADTWVLDCTAA